METEEKDTKRKKGIIKAIVTLVIIAIIIISCIFIVKSNNAEAQLKDFKASVDVGDKESVAQYLSSNNREMTTKEASHLIDYLNKKENKERLNETMGKAISNIKSEGTASELATLRDKDGDAILDFHKNGKQMVLLDKISIKPHYRDVYIKELDNNATYILSKKNKVPVDKNKLNKLGSFIVGDYNVNLSKEFDYTSVNGAIDGQIHINTDEKKKGKIIAEQSFPQTKIKVKIHNDEKLNSKNRKLLINGDVKKLMEDKTYGYFPNEDTFSVKAIGNLNGHNFKTNSVDVYKGETNNSTQTVNLYFDKKEISESIKEEKEAKSEIRDVIKDYIESLNKAYKNKSFEDVSEYIKDDSEAEKQLKPRVKQKQDIKFKNIKVKSVKKQGDKYKVEVSKKYKNNTIETEYVIDSELKQIESYTDI